MPKALKGREQGRLHPIFRDVAELTAHHSLSEKIQEAVKSSRYLIVLCSPAAKLSHWVNEEIRLFRQLHGEGAILAVIVDGVPETAFPPALTEDGREPLAADMTGGREGFRFGVTQLAASMLGVGLDRLARRDARRRRLRAQLLTAGSLIFAGVMGGMAWTAIDARDEAEKSRDDAEGLVEYMLTDLKDKLEPAGSLDILDGVGDKVIEYYNDIPLGDMEKDRRLRLARARHLVGQVAMDKGDTLGANREFMAAQVISEKAFAQYPNDPDTIFTHAQSLYWLGRMSAKERNYQEVYKFWSEYERLVENLYRHNPNHIKWIKEAGYGANNMGWLAVRQGNLAQAKELYNKAIKYLEEGLRLSPLDESIEKELANSYSGAARAVLKNADDVRFYRMRQLDIYERQLARDPLNFDVKFRYVLGKITYEAYYLNQENEEERVSIEEKLLQELLSLTKQDPENIKWARYQHQQWYRFLILGKDNLADPHLRHSIADFIELGQSYINSGKSSEYDELILRDIEIRNLHMAMEGGNIEAKIALLNKKYARENIQNGHDLSILMKLMELNYDFGSIEQARYFAKLIVQYIVSKKREGHPLNAVRFIDGLSVLGECKAAKEHYDEMARRGYYLTELRYGC